MCPRSGFLYRRSVFCTVVPVFVPSFRFVVSRNIRQNHPFGDQRFAMQSFLQFWKSSWIFPRIFRGYPQAWSSAPESIPKTATAFSSFLEWPWPWCPNQVNPPFQPPPSSGPNNGMQLDYVNNSHKSCLWKCNGTKLRGSTINSLSDALQESRCQQYIIPLFGGLSSNASAARR